MLPAVAMAMFPEEVTFVFTYFEASPHFIYIQEEWLINTTTTSRSAEIACIDFLSSMIAKQRAIDTSALNPHCSFRRERNPTRFDTTTSFFCMLHVLGAFFINNIQSLLDKY